VNGTAAPAAIFDNPTNSLTFQFTPPLPTGSLLVVLQVDEVASLVKWQKSPPAFISPKVTI
jgi:hypothetical protein